MFLICLAQDCGHTFDAAMKHLNQVNSQIATTHPLAPLLKDLEVDLKQLAGQAIQPKSLADVLESFMQQVPETVKKNSKTYGKVIHGLSTLYLEAFKQYLKNIKNSPLCPKEIKLPMLYLEQHLGPNLAYLPQRRAEILHRFKGLENHECVQALNNAIDSMPWQMGLK